MGMGKSCFTRAAIRAVAGFAGVLVLTAASTAFAADAPDSTTLFFNAHVFTAEPNAPYAEAVAIRGDRIVAVGALESVEKAAGTGARRVDLGGRFLMPGMLDAHAHPLGSRQVLGGGTGLVQANFPDTSDSLPDLVSFVGKTADSRASLVGDTVIVNGLDTGYWAHASDIDVALSAGRFADVPIVLIGTDGHTGWANRKARARAGRGCPGSGSLLQEHLLHALAGRDHGKDVLVSVVAARCAGTHAWMQPRCQHVDHYIVLPERLRNLEFFVTGRTSERTDDSCVHGGDSYSLFRR